MSAAPTPPPAAPAAGPQPKSKGLVRWGMLVSLVAVVAGLLAGAGPITKWAVQKYGSQGLGTEVKLDAASVDVFKLSVTLKNLRAVDPVDASKNQFQADEVRGTLDPVALLKGQLVVAEAVLVKPRGRLVRNADGTIGAEEPEKPPEGTSPDDPAWKKRLEEELKKRDLVEDVKKWLKKRKEAKEKREEEARKEGERREQLGIKDMDGKADYVRERRPLLVVRLLRGEGLEIAVEDKAAGAPTQTLTDATLEVREWSSDPAHHDKPMEVKLDGKLAGAPESRIKFEGLLDRRGADSLTKIDASLANLPLPALDAYFKDSLPVKFIGSTLGSLDLPLELRGWDIDWKPVMLLDKIQAEPRDPGAKIAGFEAKKVCQELTNAGKLLLQDIRVHGPIWAPKIEGDVETVKQLVLQGGKSYALKQGQKVVDEQTKKLLEKNPELQKQLEKTGAGDLLKGGTDGAGDAAKGALEKGFDLFGGKKKDHK